jgi:hypothetical protein
MSGEREVFDGRFELERGIGSGTTGRVYCARDRQTLYTVALKIFEGRTEPAELERLGRDAEKISELTSVLLMRYHAWGEAKGGGAYLALHWYDKETLRKRLARDPLTLRYAVKLGRELAWTLLSLHEVGLSHGNLKPENVLLPLHEYEPSYVSDIALPRPGRRVPRELLLAAQGFMAPELARHGEGDERCDLYSLGAILFRCLAGCMPFAADDAPSFSGAEADRRRPPRLSELRPGVQEPLSQLVERLLAFDPAARPTAREAWRELVQQEKEPGWDAGDRPPAIVLGADGVRRSVHPAAGEQPLSDEKLQRELAELLEPRCPDDAVRSGLGSIARSYARPDPHPDIVCVLCGKFRMHCAWVNLLPEGFRPVPQERPHELRSPALCSDCLHAPWRRVHAAFLDGLRFLEGDDDRAMRPHGPSRRTLRKGLRALYEHARPHLDREEPCSRCERTGETLIGACMALCAGCVDQARETRSRWLAEAKAKDDERVRQVYAGLVTRAEARVRSLGIQRSTRELEVKLPGPASSWMGETDLYTDLRHGAQSPIADPAMVERYAQRLIALLERHAVEGIRRDGDDLSGQGAHCESLLPHVTTAFFRNQAMKRDTLERLAVAAAIVLEGIQGGARYFGKNDDNLYEDQTPHFRTLSRLFGD